jgi:hypothetical protein
MRETCARVLVAALMTGAIATVVAMSAMLGTPTEPRPPIAAPPSSVQRTVRLTAQLPPRHRRSAARLVTAHTTHAQPRPEVVTRSLVVVRPHRVRRRAQHRQLATAKPQPAPPVTPAAPAVAPAAPAPAEPAPPPTGEDAENGDESEPGHGHDHGHGHGHGRGRSDQDE